MVILIYSPYDLQWFEQKQHSMLHVIMKITIYILVTTIYLASLSVFVQPCLALVTLSFITMPEKLCPIHTWPVRHEHTIVVYIFLFALTSLPVIAVITISFILLSLRLSKHDFLNSRTHKGIMNAKS